MANIKVLNQLGEEVKDLALADEVFAIEPNMQAVCDVVNSQRAAMRQGTADTKTRTEVSGGGKKPYRQKGTGRARQGSTRAPQWRGGGVVFGPTPRKYVLKVNKKVVKLAAKSILSDKLANNNLIVVDKFELENMKTKGFATVLENIKAPSDKKVIVATEDWNENVFFAGRNIPNIYYNLRNEIRVYDLINADVVVLDEAAVKEYEEELK